MRELTIIGLLLLCFNFIIDLNAALPDSSYVNKLQDINQRIESSLDENNYSELASAYYDRAIANFDVPLRNQDIIGDLIESAKVYKYLKDDLGFYNARLALAEFYILEEIYLDEAFKLTSEAFRFYKQNGIKTKVVKSTTQLGRVYQKKQDYEKAISYVEQALEGSIELQDHPEELRIRLLIIELFGKLGNVERVVEQGLYTINLEASYDLDIVSTKINHVIALNLYKDNQIDQALEYAELAQRNLTSDSQLALDNYELLSSLYGEKSMYEDAYNAALSSNNIKTDLYNQEKYALSNQLAVKYQTYEKEKEIRTLEQDNEHKEFMLDQRTRLFLILGSILLIFTIGAIYLYRLQKQKLQAKNLITKQQEEISQQKINELENSLKIKNLKAMVNGQEAERTRIATDLHDSLGGMLSTLKLQFDSLQVDHAHLSNDNDYHKIMSLIDEACTDIRDIARNLKPNALEKLGLTAALKDLINRYNSRGILDISLHVNQVDGILNQESKLHVYRIIQELLNNALKHAKAGEIDVQVNKNEHELLIMVEDNGVGFNQDEVERGLGLGNLQSRVNLLKGEINIDSVKGQGTSVVVHIPIATAIATFS